ncbi:MAG: alpha-N-arabinofuranosidase [Lachnospiraceae bacterium]|nr:alpha-N-arabinofuranosidase [Candidatus Colinaster equi]
MYKMVINPEVKKGHINPELQGHFSEHLGRCIYEGLYVGENSDIPNVNGMRKDVVEALKEMKIPVLRWPGGCFADEYHWKDGIGPKEKRKKMINTNWGGVVEDNSFGTHEFMELCKQLGCKTYINGNMGSGTVQEMSEWVEYMTFDGVSPMADMRAENGHKDSWKIDYFGVGNENWGCGGNMTPEFYANMYRRYQTFLRIYNADKPFAKVACGPNGDDYEWTDRVMKTCFDSPKKEHGFMDGLSLHYYTITYDWDNKGSATGFNKSEWYRTLNKTLFMEELIERHTAIMDKYDDEHKVGLIVDEWGIWHEVEEGTNPGFLYQQNTMRDALVAAINLNIFNKHCDRVRMANIAQMVNVLQAVVLTDGDKMILTPTYHVFKMFNCHQDAELLDSHIDVTKIGEDEWMVPNLSESASVDKDGNINITIANLSCDDAYDVESVLVDSKIANVSGEVLTAGMGDYNTFEKADTVKCVEYSDFTVNNDRIKMTIPACGVVKLTVKLAP